MRVLAGYKYHIYAEDKELKDVNKITVDGDKVQVEREYTYRGSNGCKCIGTYTETYDKEEVTIVRREEHELHSKEDKE